jgi:hypothetical protein
LGGLDDGAFFAAFFFAAAFLGAGCFLAGFLALPAGADDAVATEDAV